MALLADHAQLIRSKNAGPFWLTIDVMFDSREVYRQVRDSGVINPAAMAEILRRDIDDIAIAMHDAALAVKISLPRGCSSGSPLDDDVFGGQQYAGLLNLEIPDESVA